MGFETLILAREESYAVITLNRPPANAISETLMRELNAVLTSLQTDDGVRSVIITGSGDKIFCGTRQAQRPAINVKAAPGVQQALVGSDAERFFVPPYSGPKGWVGVWLDIDQDWDEIAELIEESYRLIAPRKLVARLDEIRGAPESRPQPKRASGSGSARGPTIASK